MPLTHSVPGLPAIEIRPSTRRKKTVAASWSGDSVLVMVPARLSRPEQHRWAEKLARDLVAKKPSLRSSDPSLLERAHSLSTEFLQGRAQPTSVRYVENQSRRWGSCTPATKDIRLSSLLRKAPSWVLDSVLLHELAHLIEPGHSDAFQDLVSPYPRLAEAEAFLEGYALGLS